MEFILFSHLTKILNLIKQIFEKLLKKLKPMCVYVSFCSKISHSYQLDRLGRRIIKASYITWGRF